VDGSPVLEINPHTIPWDNGIPMGTVFVPYSDPNFIPYLVDPGYYPYSSPDISYNLITWSSSDEDVATVNKYGHVHGVAEGEAVINLTVLPGSDIEKSACATVRVIEKPVINSVTTFDGRANPCSELSSYVQEPGGTPHPFSIDIDYNGLDFSFDFVGGSRGFAVLSSNTDIEKIENPADFNYSFPDPQLLTLTSGFEIILWQSTLSNECGGHRYVGIEHVGFDEWFVPIFKWYLFENFIDAPAGWHLQGGGCIDDTCSYGATDYPEWDPPPTPYWWEAYDWLWE
jgi:hypothetical protein